MYGILHDISRRYRKTAAITAFGIVATMISIGGANAGQITEKGRIVVHTASANVEPVPDKDGHLLGVIRLSGMGIPEGQPPNKYAYVAIVDYTNGAGPFVSYATETYADGSMLFVKHTGDASVEDGHTVFRGGKSEVLGGTGRFANATGLGSFTGARVVPLSEGGDTYFDYEITITTP